MNRTIQTDTAPPSFSHYGQAVEVPASARTLHVSGQVGVRPDGTLVEDLEGQVETAWSNVFAILEAGGMTKTDIVDVLVLVKSAEVVPVFRQVRDRVLDGHLAGRDYLSGDGLTVADFAVGVWLGYTPALGLPTAEFDNISKWYDRLAALPAWAEVVPPQH